MFLIQYSGTAHTHTTPSAPASSSCPPTLADNRKKHSQKQNEIIHELYLPFFLTSCETFSCWPTLCCIYCTKYSIEKQEWTEKIYIKVKTPPRGHCEDGTMGLQGCDCHRQVWEKHWKKNQDRTPSLGQVNDLTILLPLAIEHTPSP